MKQFNKSAICCIITANFAAVLMAFWYFVMIPDLIFVYPIVDWLIIGWVVVSFLFLIGWAVELSGRDRTKTTTKSDASSGASSVATDAGDGYDVFGPGTLELCTSASSFAEMRNHGYDWFRLIDAGAMDGSNKGTGTVIYVPATRLGVALQELECVAPEHKLHALGNEIEWTPENEKAAPFTFWAAPLAAFMRGCLEWCAETGQERVKIEFG